MDDSLRSNWEIPQIVSALPGLRRVDEGGDLMACRIAGKHHTRTAYVYLYGGTPDLISFDLEDESVETDEWDRAIKRGEVTSLPELRDIVSEWLNK